MRFPAVAVVLLLAACSFDESDGLAGKLKKLFKKSKKNCDIIWTEQVHPHCETTTEQVL
jgi:thiamine monophosphate kinase